MSHTKSGLSCAGGEFNTGTKLFCHKVSDQIYGRDKCEVTGTNQRDLFLVSLQYIKS